MCSGLGLRLGLGFIRLLPAYKPGGYMRMVLHITHFSVFRYLPDGPAHNLSGYMQDRPAYNINLKLLFMIAEHTDSVLIVTVGSVVL